MRLSPCRSLESEMVVIGWDAMISIRTPVQLDFLLTAAMVEGMRSRRCSAAMWPDGASPFPSLVALSLIQVLEIERLGAIRHEGCVTVQMKLLQGISEILNSSRASKSRKARAIANQHCSWLPKIIR